jgi:hypothetical protein
MVTQGGAGVRALPEFSPDEAAGLRELARVLRPREDALAARLIATIGPRYRSTHR